MKVLIIDDEKLIRWSFEKKLHPNGYTVFLAETGEEGIKLFEKHFPEVVFIDNKLPEIQGIDVIPKIKAIDENANIVFMTAYESVDTAVKAMKLGAIEYINKPFSFDEVILILKNIENRISKDKEIHLLKRAQKNKTSFNDIIGKSPELKRIIQLSKTIARTETTTILLLGDSGTGKDMFARAIHNESNRKNQPFVIINCSSLPETLLESELFGYEKGAFTDAKAQKKGLFEMAEGGTVFLDEIGEISHTTQVKLLNILENRTFRRLGGTKDIRVDIRIIAATNSNLKESISKKTFREDLYYRLKVFQLNLPSLRTHKEDIPALVEYFIEMFNNQFRKKVKKVPKAVTDLLTTYHWPGNIRELRNIIERSVILEQNNTLQENSLPCEIRNQNPDDKKCPPMEMQIPDEGISLIEVEIELIKKALQKANGNQTKAAKLLTISRDALRYKQKKYDI